MQLIIQSPGMVTNSSLQTLIQCKIAHLVKIYHRITKCLVVLRNDNDGQHNIYLVETQLSVPGKVLFASDRAESIELALFEAMNGLMHQLIRYKQERVDMH